MDQLSDTDSEYEDDEDIQTENVQEYEAEGIESLDDSL